MIYLTSFTFPSENSEINFIWGIERTCYDSFYPFKVLSSRGLNRIDFEPVTILYGGNGSGKSTALNIIAEKTKINRDSIFNKSNFYPDYINMCKTDILNDIPKNSRIITSDDVFDYMLNIRNLNEGIDQKREDTFQEYLEAKYSQFQLKSIADYDKLKFPAGIAHEDFTSANILFNPDCVSAVVDFDRSCYTYIWHDIGRAVLSFALKENSIDTEIVHAFLEGYKQHLTLALSDIADALRLSWCIEVPWWIQPEFFTENKGKAERYKDEILWITEHWSEIDSLIVK